MSDVISQSDARTGRLAAIYARVSSERQRQDETIQSQTVGLRELGVERGLLVVEDLVFEDDASMSTNRSCSAVVIPTSS